MVDAALVDALLRPKELLQGGVILLVVWRWKRYFQLYVICARSDILFHITPNYIHYPFFSDPLLYILLEVS